MQVRLGIVCPESSRAAFASAAATLSGVAPVWVTYVAETEIAERVQAALGQCDAICFSGELPYLATRDMIPPQLPTAVVRLTSVDVAVALLRAGEAGLPRTPFSIDTVDPAIVDELAAELDLDQDAIATLRHASGLEVPEVVEFHRRARETTETAFAITGRSNALDPLSRTLDIPVFVARPVVASIRVAMNRAALGAVSHKHSEMRFAAALFRVLDEGDLIESEVRRLSLARAIHDTVEFDDAWVEARGGGQDVLVFAHKGLMQHLTERWTAAPILTDLQKSLRLKLVVGFGLGDTARKSVEFAEAAARHAAAAGEGNAFLVSEEGVIIGPMNVSSTTAPRARFGAESHRIAQLAERLALSAETVARLVALEHEASGEPITAGEIAAKLRLTTASGRRILRVLKEHDMAVPAGTVHTPNRGRPTTMYHLRLSQSLTVDEGH